MRRTRDWENDETQIRSIAFAARRTMAAGSRPFSALMSRLKRVPGQVGDHAGAVGDAVEDVVVERDHDAVAGRVQVGLQVAVAEADRVLEGVQRVLVADQVRVLGAAAVRHRDRTVVVEVGVHVRNYVPFGW
jgi:hypothetical protein